MLETNGMHRLRVLVAVALLGFITLSAGFAAPKGKELDPDVKALAQEAVEKFIRALTAEDVDAVMGVVDVPYGWDLVKTYQRPDDVRRAFAQLFREKDLTRSRIVIDEFDTYGKLAPKLSERERKFLDQIVGKDDRLAFIKDTGRDSDDRSCVVVRVRDGQVKIVGFFG